MPMFAWTGRAADSSAATGVIESRSRTQVAQMLMGMGIVPITIVPQQLSEDAGATFARWFGRARIGTQELLMFSRQMHTLLKSGVPILRALQALQESSTHDGMRRLLGDLRSGLDSGLELSQAMARHPHCFDRFYVAMVRVGEGTGQLTETFDALYEHLDFQRLMREQVNAALRYPKFVLLAMAVALAVINLYVIPAFAKVFAGMKAELPLMTRLLLGASKFLLAAWPAMLGGGFAAGLATRAALARPRGRLVWDRWKLRLPIAGKVLRKGALSRSCRSLAMVLRSGVPLLEGISLAAAVCENAHIERAVLGMRQAVERGETVLAAARKAGIFTPIVLQMIMVGEESGTLDAMLDEVGRLYQREVEYELKSMSQQIEPILVFFLGGLVLVLALGVFMPMWDLGKAAIK
ncbi:MAG: type II secretion system F family protein [Burkholderiales bacterium]|nr:type II secretion system F family protein [Burkholderiales bacterium]